MAPSSGHLLLPKVMKIIRLGIDRTTYIIRSKLLQSTQTTTASGVSLQPIRIYARNQPIHPLAYLKQSRSQNNRWFSTTSRTLTSSAKPSAGLRYDRSKFPISNVSKAISQKGAGPFASTLRPNLTGGTLPRCAGGYSLGGAGKGARYFSHTPSCQAQVIQNVSAGTRAFLIGGGKARYDGVDPVTGEKRYKSVSQTEDAIYRKWENPLSRGTNLNFKLSPTITALSASCSPSSSTSLNSLNLLDNLSVDFARALKDLSTIVTDLNRLSLFGDLPISLTTTTSGPVLTVHFPGCDADIVSRLCDEVGVRRGVIVEDDAWNEEGNKDVEMALLFPFAPSTSPSSAVSESVHDGAGYFGFTSGNRKHDQLDWRHMLSPSIHPDSLHDKTIFQDYTTLRSPTVNARSKSPSGYESLRDSDFDPHDPYYRTLFPLRAPSHDTRGGSADYEGVEGIYRFMQVCEEARR